MIIAIDGPAASGKGTLGRRIAAHFALGYLDTGLLYRAVARDALRADPDADTCCDPLACSQIAAALNLASLDDPCLRAPGIGETASIVAQHTQVRDALLVLQRAFAARPGGAVLDGRDIGTVVCPDADAKLFVTASSAVRARRRHRELSAAGDTSTFDEVHDMILRRDERDTARAASPLRPADDAHLLDTTDLDIEAGLQAAVDWISRKVGR
ncbi:MAG: (d)CMP kinase [Pseudomonadota bacterium]